METNYHDITKFFLSRMESHPKEFEEITDWSDEAKYERWSHLLEKAMYLLPEEDAEALRSGLAKIRTEGLYASIIDEAANGPERREAERLRREEERKAYMAQAQLAQAQMQNTWGSTTNQYASALGASLTGTAPTPTATNTILGGVTKWLKK